jgi:hypothetical protein
MNLKDILERMEIDFTTTNGEKAHKHTYRIDREGNGRTLETVGDSPFHIHEIKNGDVRASGPDDHIHYLREK